jgi:hypothetical protein
MQPMTVHHLSWKTLGLYKPAFLLFCTIFSLLLSITTLLTSSNRHDIIRSDGEGYYLYLPAVFIHHDLTMQWTRPLQNKADPPDPTTGEWHGITPYRNGSYLNKYTIGQAMLWTPFFIAAHILTIVTGRPATGFTIWYQAAVGFAAAFYASLGCVMIYKLLRRYFSVRVSYFTVLTLLLGTNMLSYATYDSSFTHVGSLFLIAAILYLIPKWYGNMTYRTSILLAVLLALNVIVRQTNILILLVVLLWGVTGRAQLRQRVVLLWRQRQKLAVMTEVGLLVALPQLLYWKYITGKWFVFSYRGEGFHFLHPQIINVLISTDRGVLFWAPVLLLSLVGLVLLRRHLKEWSTPIYVFLPVWLWVISSWHSWQFGESYGHRAFIDIFPLLGLALAVVYSRAKSPAAKCALLVIVGLCIFANLFLTYQYWIRGLLAADTTMHTYLKVWKLGLAGLVHNGLTFGFLGLIGLIGVTLGPLTHYFLVAKERVRPDLKISKGE